MAEELLTPSIGGIIEEKEIGLSISTKGTHVNTYFDEESGTVKLVVKDTDGSGRNIYEEAGTWTSEVINLGDKFKSFQKIFTDAVDAEGSTHKVYTRSSSNNRTWSEWEEVSEDGMIQSPMNQFFQVKIELAAGFVTDAYLISEFTKGEDVNLFNNNAFVSTENGLRLKRNYEFDMTLDSTWTEEGSLHRKLITRDEWVRIDKMNVLSKQ